MYLAILETQNFTFHAAGATETHALDALRIAWHVHARQTRAAASFDEWADAVHILELTPGACFRDYEKFL